MDKTVRRGMTNDGRGSKRHTTKKEKRKEFKSGRNRG
jgi:hypothetical protein